MTEQQLFLSDRAQLKVLDLRHAEAFRQRRLRLSHNIPEAQLLSRLFELPPKPGAFAILTPGPEKCATNWQEWFQKHGWHCPIMLQDSEQLWQEANAAGEADISGSEPPIVLMFEPCPLLTRYVDTVEASLPSSLQWSCLDIGCGSGRDMLFLALRGWRCTGIDNWKAALLRLQQAASNYRVSDRIDFVRAKLDDSGELSPFEGYVEQSAKLSSGTFDLLLNIRFLNRHLFPQMRAWVKPGGYLLLSTFMSDPDAADEVARLYPKGERHLLQHGELADSFGPEYGFSVVFDDASQLPDGRLVSNFVARKEGNACA